MCTASVGPADRIISGPRTPFLRPVTAKRPPIWWPSLRRRNRWSTQNYRIWPTIAAVVAVTQITGTEVCRIWILKICGFFFGSLQTFVFFVLPTDFRLGFRGYRTWSIARDRTSPHSGGGSDNGRPPLRRTPSRSRSRTVSRSPSIRLRYNRNENTSRSQTGSRSSSSSSSASSRSAVAVVEEKRRGERVRSRSPPSRPRDESSRSASRDRYRRRSRR